MRLVKLFDRLTLWLALAILACIFFLSGMVTDALLVPTTILPPIAPLCSSTALKIDGCPGTMTYPTLQPAHPMPFFHTYQDEIRGL